MVFHSAKYKETFINITVTFTNPFLKPLAKVFCELQYITIFASAESVSIGMESIKVL